MRRGEGEKEKGEKRDSHLGTRDWGFGPTHPPGQRSEIRGLRFEVTLPSGPQDIRMRMQAGGSLHKGPDSPSVKGEL